MSFSFQRPQCVSTEGFSVEHGGTLAKYGEVSSLGGFRVIDAFSDDLVDGNSFGVFHEQLDYESDQTFGLFWETLDNDLTLTLRGNFTCGTDSLLYFYEGVTVNPGAVPTNERVAVNPNRLYPSALANVKSIAASPTVGSFSYTDTTETSPVASVDTVVGLIPFGGDRTRFASGGISNVILAPNKIYGLEFTPGGAGGTAELAVLQLIWSEGTIATDDELESLSFLEDVRQRILRVRNIVV